MKRFKIGLTLATVSVFSVGLLSVYAGPDDDKTPKGKEPPKPLCPVMGNPVVFTVSTMTDEGPVYFCCPPCIKKYKADPKKYAEKVSEQRKVLANLPRVQVSCPVTGKPIAKDSFVEHKGQKFFLCGPGCVKKFQKEPDKYKAGLAGGYTYQTKCPVTDKEIDPGVFTTLKNGQKIYFCSKMCNKKFLDEPAKYAPNLDKQGYFVDPKDMKAGADSTKSKHKGHKKCCNKGHRH